MGQVAPRVSIQRGTLSAPGNIARIPCRMRQPRPWQAPPMRIQRRTDVLASLSTCKARKLLNLESSAQRSREMQIQVLQIYCSWDFPRFFRESPWPSRFQEWPSCWVCFRQPPTPIGLARSCRCLFIYFRLEVRGARLVKNLFCLFDSAGHALVLFPQARLRPARAMHALAPPHAHDLPVRAVRAAHAIVRRVKVRRVVPPHVVQELRRALGLPGGFSFLEIHDSADRCRV